MGKKGKTDDERGKILLVEAENISGDTRDLFRKWRGYPERFELV